MKKILPILLALAGFGLMLWKLGLATSLLIAAVLCLFIYRIKHNANHGSSCCADGTSKPGQPKQTGSCCQHKAG